MDVLIARMLEYLTRWLIVANFEWRLKSVGMLMNKVSINFLISQNKVSGKRCDYSNPNCVFNQMVTFWWCIFSHSSLTCNWWDGCTLWVSSFCAPTWKGWGTTSLRHSRYAWKHTTGWCMVECFLKKRNKEQDTLHGGNIGSEFKKILLRNKRIRLYSVYDNYIMLGLKTCNSFIYRSNSFLF